ncbi:hypothetical protein CTA2_8387 [Colletotrichum tanaceti]|uniref:Protein kinase domain-containing protein n=1 Tax=Colletotrichum tanaceti TaxID=1306861 RepID=A0A4U6XPJ6_9PEZI|nr:hypothetical protein CTA2_8387 [Colletotrichum tanaceti]TKW57725.1 hypothetical protein CTA1_11520 [Colletotrichum tanaceti]
MDNGTFDILGRNITFRVADQIGMGCSGTVYSIECINSACNELGHVVLKVYPFHHRGDAVSGRENLAKIGELKAVGSNDVDEYEYTLMTRWDGVTLTKLPTYQRLLMRYPTTNYNALVEFVNSAFLMAAKEAEAHIINNHITHEDIHLGNILLQESDGKIISARLIDWDLARISPADKV